MKVAGKNVAGITIYAVLYIAIIYGSLCLGYLHPFFWVYASVVSMKKYFALEDTCDTILSLLSGSFALLAVLFVWIKELSGRK